MRPLEREVVDRSSALKELFDSSGVLPEVGDTILGPKDAEIGILLQHGFAGSNIEMLYLGNRLALQGFRVLIPLLPGHGTDSNDLLNITYKDWIEKHNQAYNFLEEEKAGREIIAVGHSLGGTLSLYLASNHEELKATISIAGPIEFNLTERLIIKLLGRLPLKYPYEDFEFYDDRLYSHPSVQKFNENYGRMPMHAFRQVFELLKNTSQSIKNIKQPVGLIYSRNDPTVPPYHVSKLVQWLGSDEIDIRWLEESYHIIVVDKDRDRLADYILEFIDHLS